MEKFVIEGKRKLSGKVFVGTSKNSTLPIMAASILIDKLIINEVPLLQDVYTFIEVLKVLGLKVKLNEDNKSLVIGNRGELNYEAPYDLVRKMRASFLVLGPLLARKGMAKVSLPGGCAIGARPVDLHLKAFEKLGVSIKIEEGYVIAKAENGLKGNKIVLDYPSVGATENIIMAAVLAKGKTVIYGAAKEPEIIDLCNFLRKVGAKIDGAGTDTVVIEGVDSLFSQVNYTPIKDRIEAGTFIIAGALLGENLEIIGVDKEFLESFFDKLEQMGVDFKLKDNICIVNRTENLNPIDIKTAPYPGFPTDLQAQMMVLLTQANGDSVITETVFENRFMHALELMRMGADIRLEGKVAHIKGNINLKAAPVMASDLRAGAALVLAGLIADGITEVRRIYHIDRGYEKLDEKLQKVGAKIYRRPQ